MPGFTIDLSLPLGQVLGNQTHQRICVTELFSAFIIDLVHRILQARLQQQHTLD
jgi:hypothetical protein